MKTVNRRSLSLSPHWFTTSHGIRLLCESINAHLEPEDDWTISRSSEVVTLLWSQEKHTELLKDQDELISCTEELKRTAQKYRNRSDKVTQALVEDQLHHHKTMEAEKVCCRDSTENTQRAARGRQR